MASDAHAAPLKIALVGCGKMGLNHVRAIQACPGATLVAVADPAVDAAKLPAALPAGVKVFTSASDMLDTAMPDVVHIVTPPATHAELAKQCLARGAHVYVEKPFTPTAREAAEVLDAAARAGKQACAGHQLLFETPARALGQALPVIGQVVHVESYFSFRTVRKSIDGRAPLSPVEQLLDILPHPTYTLLNVLRTSHAMAAPEMVSLEVRAEGEVRALFRAGEATAVMIVTLRGRPVESYLRVVGTNGSLRADFVRGTLLRLPGAGTSTIALMINPYREAKQIAWGSTVGFLSRIRGKKKGYPGLCELFEAFYHAVQSGQPSPLDPSSILETVRTCERIGQDLRAADAERERQAATDLSRRELQLPPVERPKGTALVTGGSGMLGRAVVRELRRHGWAVRSLSRNVPPASNREPGVHYAAGDLSVDLPPTLFAGVSTVVHCAAETAGGKEAHDRNTVAATRNLLRAAAASGVRRFLHVSSIAVLKPGRTSAAPLSEESPVDFDNLGRGPYVWAKAEAEREVTVNGPTLGLDVRVVRPGPLVDFKAYEAPGRLGRELGPFFVAVGPRSARLSLCDVQTGAQVIRFAADDFEAMPAVVNMVEPDAPTREALVGYLRERRPDLTTLWMPRWLLAVLSPMAKLGQKILRPKAKPIDIAAAFSSEKYNSSVVAEVMTRAHAAQPGVFARSA